MHRQDINCASDWLNRFIIGEYQIYILMIWIWYFYFVLERIKSSAKFNDFGERIRIRDLFLCKMLDFAGVWAILKFDFSVECEIISM